MAEYNANTNLFDQVGNLKFGQIMTSKRGRNLVSKKHWKHYSEPYLIYHSWLSGFIEISKNEMTAFEKIASVKSASILFCNSFSAYLT